MWDSIRLKVICCDGFLALSTPTVVCQWWWHFFYLVFGWCGGIRGKRRKVNVFSIDFHGTEALFAVHWLILPFPFDSSLSSFHTFVAEKELCWMFYVAFWFVKKEKQEIADETFSCERESILSSGFWRLIFFLFYKIISKLNCRFIFSALKLLSACNLIIYCQLLQTFDRSSKTFWIIYCTSKLIPESCFSSLNYSLIFKKLLSVCELIMSTILHRRDFYVFRLFFSVNTSQCVPKNKSLYVWGSCRNIFWWIL